MNQPPADQDRDPQQGGQPRNEGNQDQQSGQYPPPATGRRDSRTRRAGTRTRTTPAGLPPAGSPAAGLSPAGTGPGAALGPAARPGCSWDQQGGGYQQPGYPQQYPPGPPRLGPAGLPSAAAAAGIPAAAATAGLDPNQQNYAELRTAVSAAAVRAAAGDHRHAVDRRRVRPQLPAAARLERHRPRAGRGLPACRHLGLPPARRRLLRRPVGSAARSRFDQRHHRQRLIRPDLATRGRRRDPYRPFDGRVRQPLLIRSGQDTTCPHSSSS